MQTAKQQKDFFWSACCYSLSNKISSSFTSQYYRSNMHCTQAAHMFNILQALPLHSLIMYWKSVYVYGL